MSLWWLSFCENEPPGAGKFLGACIVEGDDVVGAIREAHRLGIDPGGQVLGIQTPPRLADQVPLDFTNRLLSEAECREFDAVMGALSGEPAGASH